MKNNNKSINKKIISILFLSLFMVCGCSGPNEAPNKIEKSLMASILDSNANKDYSFSNNRNAYINESRDDYIYEYDSGMGLITVSRIKEGSDNTKEYGVYSLIDDKIIFDFASDIINFKYIKADTSESEMPLGNLCYFQPVYLDEKVALYDIKGHKAGNFEIDEYFYVKVNRISNTRLYETFGYEIPGYELYYCVDQDFNNRYQLNKYFKQSERLDDLGFKDCYIGNSKNFRIFDNVYSKHGKVPIFETTWNQFLLASGYQEVLRFDKSLYFQKVIKDENDNVTEILTIKFDIEKEEIFQIKTDLILTQDSCIQNLRCNSDYFNCSYVKGIKNGSSESKNYVVDGELNIIKEVRDDFMFNRYYKIGEDLYYSFNDEYTFNSNLEVVKDFNSLGYEINTLDFGSKLIYAKTKDNKGILIDFNGNKISDVTQDKMYSYFIDNTYLDEKYIGNGYEVLGNFPAVISPDKQSVIGTNNKVLVNIKNIDLCSELVNVVDPYFNNAYLYYVEIINDVKVLKVIKAPLALPI